MSMSPAVLRAHAVGTEWQEGRMDVISAAGSRTSLPLTHAWSKNRALLPVTWALKKPDCQMFKSIPSPLESFQNMKWWCFTDGHISVALTTMRRGQWRSQRTREDEEVTAGDSSDRCMVTFHSGWHGQESSKRAREWVRERELKKNEVTLCLGASCPGSIDLHPETQRIPCGWLTLPFDQSHHSDFITLFLALIPLICWHCTLLTIQLMQTGKKSPHECLI